MLSNANKILIISGLLLSLVNRFTIDNNWLEMISLTIVLVGILLSKRKIVESDEYGVYYYYVILSLYMLMVFFAWFK